MVWILMAIAAMSLWAVSLFKVLNASCVPARPAFLSNGSGRSGEKRTVLLVVAHPDDESMFFAPTILYLTSEGHNIHILCLSTGNAEGKGNVRREEFYRACAILKVPLQQVKILDHPNLQDGFDKAWEHRLISTIIEGEVKIRGIDLLITFDNSGVSGHPNHGCVYHGLCMFLRENSREDIEAWKLVSTSILRKYSGPVDIWQSMLCTLSHPQGQTYCLLNRCPHKSYVAMAEHYSQWVWYASLRLSTDVFHQLELTIREISLNIN